MKLKNLLASVFAFLIVFSACVPSCVLAEEAEEVPDDPGIISGNAIVAYCIDEEQFLYGTRMDERVEPTVATKLVATMVAVDILTENGKKSEDVIVTVTKESVDNITNLIDYRIPMMALKDKNEYSAQDLLSASLVACAHDAISALAYYLAEKYLDGGVELFVDRMNQKVESLGLTSTHFVNVTGINADGQYTTPREVALIAAAFYQYNELVTLSDVEHFRFNKTSLVRNKNYLKNNYYVAGYLNKNAIGLIAGQLNTKEKYCLITATQKEGKTYVYVVMCATGLIVARDEETDIVSYSFGQGNAYDDMNKLISWTRNSFELLSVATTDKILGELRVKLGSTADHVMVVPSENIEKLVLKSNQQGALTYTLSFDESIVYKEEFNGAEQDTISAPIVAGQKVGTVTYYYNGEELCTVDAITKEGIEADGVKATLDTAKGFLFGGVMKTVLWVIIGVIIIYAVISIITLIVKISKKAKKSKNRKKAKAVKAIKSKHESMGDTKEHF